MAKLIVIAGPTASGKTALAVSLALRLGTEILSADSRQCFRELNIAVAKPTPQEMNGIPHYFIDSHSITENVNAGVYEKYGLAILEKIFSHSEYAILVGGTGLYIRALCEGIDPMPPIPTDIRASVKHDFEINGLTWLQQELQQRDPLFWQTAEQQNPQRLMRALEMILATGQSITTFRSKNKVTRPFEIIKYAMDWPRETLYQRINQRVDDMVQNGIVEEARMLLPFRKLNALQTVGYKEFFDYFDGKTNIETAIDELKKNTRHYAKRQITWFKKDPDFQWVASDALETILNKVSQ